jgi:hypothetical protein
MESQDKTPTGDPIYRYTEPAHKDLQPARGIEHIEEISDHIEKHLGPIETVFHEMISHLVHIDVHYIKPSGRFPWHILVTSGMSDLPMHVPEGLEAHQYAELCILLPANWPLSQEAFKDENNYWPVRWLKEIARFPHEYETWVGWGHTIPNGSEAAPFAGNTGLGCMLLLPSISLPEDFVTLKTKDGLSINFYCLYPLYKEELDYKLKEGCDKLLDKFEEHEISDVIEIKRTNTCRKKGLPGF